MRNAFCRSVDIRSSCARRRASFGFLRRTLRRSQFTEIERPERDSSVRISGILGHETFAENELCFGIDGLFVVPEPDDRIGIELAFLVRMGFLKENFASRDPD